VDVHRLADYNARAFYEHSHFYRIQFAKVSVMPNRFLQVALSRTVAVERLTVIGLLVIAIINIIVVSGVIIVRTPLAEWAA
jgi:hypothetical protein